MKEGGTEKTALHNYHNIFDVLIIHFMHKQFVT